MKMKMKMMKRLLTLALAAMMALTLLAGCGGKAPSKSSAPAVDPQVLADDLYKALAPKGEMLEVKDTVAANYYSIDAAAVKAYKIYVSSMYMGEEVAVFQLADTAKADDVKKLCQTRIKDLEDSFEGYLPEQYDQVKENAQVLAKGDIVCLLVGSKEGTAAAKAAFEKAVA